MARVDPPSPDPPSPDPPSPDPPSPRPRRRLCANCDNRHACRTPEPRCLTLPRSADERTLSGRELMRARGLLAHCEGCDLFRQCWRLPDYRLALANGDGDGDTP